jgi:hypothetical protein
MTAYSDIKPKKANLIRKEVRRLQAKCGKPLEMPSYARFTGVGLKKPRLVLSRTNRSRQDV